MSKLSLLFATTKAKIIAAVVMIAVVGGAGGGIAYYRHTQTVKDAQAEAAKKEKAHQEALKTSYETAKFQLENAILEETERKTLLDSLKGYRDVKKLDTKKEKAFHKLTKSIKEKYDASLTTLENAVAGLSTAYPSEEGYYNEEFTASVNALTEELNTLKADGKYQEAYNKYNEINAAYVAYVDRVNAEKAAAEAAEQKAQADASKKNNNTDASKNTNSGKKNSSGSASSASSAGSNASSGNASESTPAGGDSGKSASQQRVEADRAAWDAAKAQANAQGSPVPFEGRYLYPDSWTPDDMAEWAEANGLITTTPLP